MNIPRTIIFIGPQGSGKGTQIELLQQLWTNAGAAPLLIETGQLFRDLSATETYASKYIADALKSGELLPNVVTNGLVVEQLLRKLTATNRLVFDGYPRNLEQAKTLLKLLAFLGRAQVEVVHISISDELALERMLERGRNDDTPEVITARLTAYHEHTEPLLDWCRQQSSINVHSFDGALSIETVHEQIVQILT